MMNTAKLPTAKDYRMAIKRKWTISDIREKFGFSTEEDVVEHIRLQYEREKDSREVMRALKKNEKHPHKSEECSKENTLENISEAVENILEVEENTSEENDVAVEETLKEETSKKSYEELLSEKEAELETRKLFVVDLELERKALNSRKYEINKNLLPESRKELEALKKALMEAKTKVMSYCDELENITSKSAELSELIKIGKEDVSKLEAEVAELKRVNICVYADGNLEVLDATTEIPEVEQTEWLMVVANHSESCENLTINQVKSVCQLKKLVTEISRKGGTTNIVFESEVAESLYQAIKG